MCRRAPDRLARQGAVTRITHLGFEVKVDVELDDGASCWVQLSRGTATDLGLEPGQRVWVASVESPEPVEPSDPSDAAEPTRSTLLHA